MDFVGRHEIKINRAMRLAEIGRYPASAAAMLRPIPAKVIASVTAKTLAAILDANWRIAQESKAIAIKDALDEGGLWDNCQQRFRALAQ